MNNTKFIKLKIKPNQKSAFIKFLKDSFWKNSPSVIDIMQKNGKTFAFENHFYIKENTFIILNKPYKNNDFKFYDIYEKYPYYTISTDVTEEEIEEFFKYEKLYYKLKKI